MAKPPTKVLLAGAGALLLLAVLAVGAFTVGPFGRGGIEQPIAFPHDIHAGTNQIPCMYCHTRRTAPWTPASRPCSCAPAATSRAARRCSARTGRRSRSWSAYWREQRPIPWERIYKVPDHVRFPHMRHVAAEIECQECHGPVETMQEVEVYQPLRMGWCIDCHRQREARIDCFVCHY
jgi:hypothetical protein